MCVLPDANRMRRSEDFQRAVRRGSRAAGSTMVVHAMSTGDDQPARVGLVVSRAVGNAVVRNRVKRRLRHAVRPHLARLGPALVVIRAKPSAATADVTRLGRELDRCLAGIEGPPS